MEKAWLYPECNLPVISNTYSFALSDELQGLPRLKGYEPVRNEVLRVPHSLLQLVMVSITHSSSPALAVLSGHRAALSGQNFPTEQELGMGLLVDSGFFGLLHTLEGLGSSASNQENKI